MPRPTSVTRGLDKILEVRAYVGRILEVELACTNLIRIRCPPHVVKHQVACLFGRLVFITIPGYEETTHSTLALTDDVASEHS